MKWEKSFIVGHSYGGVIAFGLAATFPELVNRLAIIDNVGALSVRADKTVKNLRKAILEEERLSEKTSGPKIYASLLEAANARVRNSTAFSKKMLSLEAAKLLVAR